MLKIYSDNTREAIVVDEENKSYWKMSHEQAKKVNKSIVSRTTYKSQVAQVVQDLEGRYGYERMK